MSIPAFDAKELEVVSKIPMFTGEEIPVFNYPVSMREANKALFAKKPYWQMTCNDQAMFCPLVNPDNIARGFIFEARKLDEKEFGGKDMFGIEWEYIASVGGSMVRPGKPFAEDADELLEKVVWPNPDEWDWEAAAEANKGYFDTNKYNVCWFLNGWYERLIAFMDFENAIMAVFDEDQQESVHKFFDKLTDLYIDILDKYIKYFPEIDGFCIHDDWGSQKETFFSPALAEEMIVPYMKRVTDFLHSKGKTGDIHSCGQNYKQVPNYIKAGWDMWIPQAMNDTQKIYEEYGDKLIIAVVPDKVAPDATEEEQRAAAREFIDKFMQPGKPCLMSYHDMSMCTPAYMEELYAYSRKKAIEIN
ncbi:MAG: methyltransferase [Oscillospiraceae bacterium]|nr:methyltransferase [Oscillospiraceae bacterium]